MMGFIREGGVIMIPLLIVTFVMLALAVRAWLRLGRGDAAVGAMGTGIDAVLFWGAYAVVLGLLGTLVGISQAAGAISRMGTVSAAFAWGGIKVAISTTIYGLLVFAVALLLWFALRSRHRRRLAVRAG